MVQSSDAFQFQVINAEHRIFFQLKCKVNITLTNVESIDRYYLIGSAIHYAASQYPMY